MMDCFELCLTTFVSNGKQMLQLIVQLDTYKKIAPKGLEHIAAGRCLQTLSRSHLKTSQEKLLRAGKLKTAKNMDPKVFRVAGSIDDL